MFSPEHESRDFRFLEQPPDPIKDGAGPKFHAVSGRDQRVVSLKTAAASATFTIGLIVKEGARLPDLV